MPIRMLQRRGEGSSWSQVVLGPGEIGLDTTNGKCKIGNGTDIWEDIPYYSIQKYDTVLNWENSTAIPALGLLCLDESGYLKLGDGINQWINLDYFKPLEALLGGASASYDTLGKIEDIVIQNIANTETNAFDIATSESNIASNTSNISTNTSNIATNTSTISNHQAYIDSDKPLNSLSDVTITSPASGQSLIYSGTQFVNAVIDSVPAGVISAFAGSSAPTGYKLCNGGSYNTTTDSKLFNVIGYTYGGSGSSFNVPNLSGRVPVGRDATQTEFDALGETGGLKAETIAEANLPSHSHTINHDHPVATTSSDSHTHDIPDVANTGSGSGAVVESWGGGSGGRTLRTGSDAHNHTVDLPAFSGTSGTSGGGVSFPILQPYIVLNYIIKS
jgi:microcystin-dependent protein